MRSLALLVLLLVPVSAMAQKVTVDHDPGFDFAQPTTFAWGEGGTPAPNEINQRRLLEMLETELQTKGLTRVEEAAPDLFVVTHAVSRQQQRSSNVNIGIGVAKYGKRGAVSVGGSTSGRRRTVEQGTLVISIYDGKSGDLVWQAIAEGTVKGSAEKRRHKIEQAIQKALGSYPPTK